jgi:acetyltransferase-like isoleucine patch superfamily enzyme
MSPLPVQVPTTDVNSESGVVVDWFVADRAQVKAGEILVEIETSKAVLEVPAPADGVLLQRSAKGAEHKLDQPVALLFTDAADLESYVDAERTAVEATPREESPVRATAKAISRAAELGVDLAALPVSDALITVADVEAAAAAATVDVAALPAPLTADPGVQRILVIGGGLGATQVIDIFAAGTTQRAVAIVDDARDRWGASVFGVPIVGGADRIGELFAAGAFDAAVVAISTSVAVRRKFREACRQLGVPLANAIDPTAKIATDVELGQGNVICAFCHLGTGVRVGDNNFLSAYNSFDHHSRLGNDISTGPSCYSSGLVTLGDQVRLGTGIFLEPHVELGDRVQVASGSVIVRSVPADHTVKTKIVTTVVVPSRR